ncbi:MAG: hypothetical protein HYY26_07415 [Acidobacteria bacterium]|nr:hypothetical protein [Acidobacteriota bacterium]
MTWLEVAFAALVVLALAAGWYKYSISTGAVPKVLEFYLWLTPILTFTALRLLHARAGLQGLVPIAVVHLAIVAWALWIVHPSTCRGVTPWLDGVLLVVGAAVVWLGAITFAGMELQGIAAHRGDHLFTVGGFLVGALLSLAGFMGLSAHLRERGEILLSQLGLLALIIGTVCWILHLAFRATVMLAAAQESAAPTWYPPLRLWAGAMYAAYMVLAYLSIAFYGAAMQKTGLAGKGWGRTFVAFGLIAATGFVAQGWWDVPLAVQFMPYAMGMILLRRAMLRASS